MGVRVARNKGIEVASKEFVMFVDSVDIVNINLINKFATCLNISPKLDVFYLNYTSFKDEKLFTITDYPITN